MILHSTSRRRIELNDLKKRPRIKTIKLAYRFKCERRQNDARPVALPSDLDRCSGNCVQDWRQRSYLRRSKRCGAIRNRVASEGSEIEGVLCPRKAKL